MLTRPPPLFGAPIGILPRCFPRSVPALNTTVKTTAATKALGSPVNIVAAYHWQGPSQLRWQSQLRRPQAQAQTQVQAGRTPTVSETVQLSGRSPSLVMRLVGVIWLASTSTRSSSPSSQKEKRGVVQSSNGGSHASNGGEQQAQLPPTATNGIPQLKAPKLGEIFFGPGLFRSYGRDGS